MRVGATTKETLMRMRAARMHGYNEPLQIDDVQVPEVGPTQVLIKVAATGMFRSDWDVPQRRSARRWLLSPGTARGPALHTGTRGRPHHCRCGQGGAHVIWA